MPEALRCKVCGDEQPEHKFNHHRHPSPEYDGVCAECAYLKIPGVHGFEYRWYEDSKEYQLMGRALAHNDGFRPSQWFPGGPHLLAELIERYLDNNHLHTDYSNLHEEYKKRGFPRGPHIYDTIIFGEWLRYEIKKARNTKREDEILSGLDEKKRYNPQDDYRTEIYNLGQLLWNTEAAAREAVSIEIKFPEQERKIRITDRRLLDLIIRGMAESCKQSGVIDAIQFDEVIDADGEIMKDVPAYYYNIPDIELPQFISHVKTSKVKGADLVNEAVGVGLFCIQEYIEGLDDTLMVPRSLYPPKTIYLVTMCQFAGVDLRNREGESLYQANYWKGVDEYKALRDRITDLYNQYIRDKNGIIQNKRQNNKREP